MICIIFVSTFAFQFKYQRYGIAIYTFSVDADICTHGYFIVLFPVLFRCGKTEGKLLNNLFRSKLRIDFSVVRIVKNLVTVDSHSFQ
ncbi:MAG: hypothetical protein A2W90_10460 [Bacteroidetes bacterium GWF2_42_66]|nr:MAG: hypothetical protein A2W92_24155 [Bacteroidetes bacterium GWA2_42_15]OFY01488.1 MAG: hypothetical protein A2W89_02055 [Bacteroidetes bacterium GWE2_42_39]OFY43331.1 MAG: hypothetical protein A2W90_10460 [Bacteroidetes bacterium GWF2_42_66]HBL77486.1 hypothetical protein [Prolixibacteraceae bacterium]HCR91289.1 hypothetical protein [Prolixibacteraceae bacterium]